LQIEEEVSREFYFLSTLFKYFGEGGKIEILPFAGGIQDQPWDLMEVIFMFQSSIRKYLDKPKGK